jgi:hypothetical protein
MIFISALAFAIALILNLAGISKGHVDPATFELVGLLCLALSFCPWGWIPARGVRRTDQPQP